MKRNHYILITIVITLCIHTSCSRQVPAETAPPKTSPAAFAAAISEADSLFRQRADVSKLKQAIDVLAKVRVPGDRNFEVEWKFAEYSYFLGGKMTDENESKKTYESGRDAGSNASSMEPAKPDGYFWYGANLGELSRLNPLTVGVKSIDDLKGSMNKVIEIQPGYQNSSAYDALAQIEMDSRMFGGTPDKAIELLEKALQTEKNNMDMRIHLAEAYLAVKRDRDARSQLEQALQMRPNPEYLPEYNESLEEARKMLKTKF